MSEFAEHLHLRLRWSSAFSFVQQLGQMTRRPSSKPPLQIPMTLLQELSSRLPQYTAASCDAFHLEIHELQQVMSKQSPKPPPKKVWVSRYSRFSSMQVCHTQITWNNTETTTVIKIHESTCFCNGRPSIQSILHFCPNVWGSKL